MYIVPKRMSKKTELFDGIGGREIAVFVVFFGVGLIMFLLLSPFGIGIIIRLAVLGIFSSVGVALIYPLKYKENLLTLGARYFKFQNQQNRYFFYRGTGGFSINNIKDE